MPRLFWENDPFIASDYEPSDSNHGITLKEAKFNFSKFGACEKEMLCYVRSPRDDEKKFHSDNFQLVELKIEI